MKRLFLLFLVLSGSYHLFSQVILIIEGREINDTTTGTSSGISIPRSQPTIFKFRNNSLTSVNAYGYMLQAGDEAPIATNGNLNGEIITGNRFTWNGKDEKSMTHALFTGYNVDVIIKYNYLYNTPNGIQRKSNGMTDNDGVVAYNIINNPKLGIAVKGINGVKIYNNTFYSEKTPAQTWRGLVDICINTDGGLRAVSEGTKVFNNIFYTKNKVFNIKIQESECLAGFESDYNLFWCEAGEPVFEINGQTKSFAQWKALGYDLHSIVIDPEFLDFTDFIPRFRLDYGISLGLAFQAGLSTDAIWGKTNPATTDQNGVWQVGARIYKSSVSGQKIYVYPNPVSDVLYISTNDMSLTYNTVKIFDLQGRVLFTDILYNGSIVVKIPEYFASGIYNVALESDNLKRYIKKIVIIK